MDKKDINDVRSFLSGSSSIEWYERHDPKDVKFFLNEIYNFIDKQNREQKILDLYLEDIFHN